MRKKRIAALFCAVSMAVMLAACTSEAPGKSSDDTKDSSQTKNENVKTPEEITIGVSFGQNVHPFFVAMQKGIEQACEDNHIKKCNILSSDSSLETQNSQIENLVTMGCDVILLNPYDSEGVVNAVSNAKNAGVGVFTMDVDCEGSTAFIASDNKEIGKMLAEYVKEQLGDKGKIAIIDGITVSSLKDRTEGFKEALEGSGIEIVAEQQTAHARDTALASAENILQANPDIDAFVGVNENSGMAILSAATSAKLNPLMTTVDATSENMTAIRDGKVAVGVSQDPYQMGYKAVEQAIAWCQGKSVDEFIEVPVEYMNIDNIQEFIDREKGYGVEVD
ncbi:ribose ABC transporter substrate-binding protein RbsB [Faecalicatena orotica]|uniref:Monosaccharide ABC transporter substrate-binding protein (CUT2 family) n=1 Tax=Faecalicatena orotica TaxID=1544 RepID=A0A2Y9BFY8_9FIRM|nr:sugar ABC transporter substrate-binding protein [Faecalicatena orotica]PWJ28576.1 monosaccharide ABC transporter substrate-binding protein (CUT2 family) [Faecalicatena orotica]SSA56397.1 monosaccharide ABC transporter substrate-binding protein, CUT2 family [Faecalicatena orotica]